MITRRKHVALLAALVSILVIGAGAWAFATSSLRSHPAGPVSTASASLSSERSVSIVECVPGNLVRQPDALALSCADANQYLMDLVWQDWGQDQATAKGWLVSNDCKPTCVSGHDLRTKVEVVAGDLAIKSSAARYTSLSVTVQGSSQAQVYELPGFDDPYFN